MLRNYFVKDSSVGKVALIKRLCKMEHAEGDDVREYLLEMEELFDKLRNAGCRMDDDIKACFVLANLPESYNSIVSAIHGRMDALTMNFVKTKLTEEYDSRKEKFSIDSEKVLAARSTVKDVRNPGSSRLCYACGSPDHLMRDCGLLKKVREEDQRTKDDGKRNKALSATAKERNPETYGGDFCFAAIQEETTMDWN